MNIIQVVKGDTGPHLRATVTRSDTGGAFVGTSNCILKIRKKATTTVISTISLDVASSNLATGTLVFPLSSFLTDNNTVEGFYEGEITFTLADATTMSVFELIDFKVREDF
jgi:hypothetical protein|tara:strand:- start:764 stop:1096 length:333 start_codon:yes stop_codon:yes gene_type:complete